MTGRFGPGCCFASGYCTDPDYQGKPSEVLIDFDTVDFDNDVVDDTHTGWDRTTSGLDTQITETFSGSTVAVDFVDSPMISINTVAQVGYARAGYSGGPITGLVPSGDRPLVVAELEFTMVGALTYAWNNGFAWFATTAAGFSLTMTWAGPYGIVLEYVAGYNYVSLGHADNGRMYRLRGIISGHAGGPPSVLGFEILNTTGVGLPAKILDDGDVCLMRVEPTGGSTADVSLYINGVLQVTNNINLGGIDLENFACSIYPGAGWGGTLRNTDEVSFELDDLRWEMQGTP